MTQKLLIGRNVWCQLPDLHLPVIKGKIDTGAKTSALHAINIRVIRRNGKKFVKFDVHPLQRNKKILISCKAPLIDTRHIMSSNGHIEHRYVIETTLVIANQEWKIEMTLSNRDPLRYRLLLGREALIHRVLIDPSLSCHQKKVPLHKVTAFYPSSTASSRVKPSDSNKRLSLRKPSI